MSHQTPLQISLSRTRMPDLDPRRDQQVQDWLDRASDIEVVTMGGLSDQVALCTMGSVVRGGLAGVVEPGQDQLLVALVRSIGGPEVVTRHRLCEVSLPGPSGAQRFAVHIQLWADRPAWRASVRPFRATADRVGKWQGPWDRRAGRGPRDAPPWLRPLIDAGAVRLPPSAFGPEPSRWPDLRPTFLPPLEAPLPDDPRALLVALHRSVDPEIFHRGFWCVIIFVLRPDSVERWELYDPGQYGLDDIISALCQVGPAWAVAVINPGIAELPDGRSLRAISSTCELAGQLGRRARPLVIQGNRVTPLEPWFAPLEPVRDSFFTRATPLSFQCPTPVADD